MHDVAPETETQQTAEAPSDVDGPYDLPPGWRWSKGRQASDWFPAGPPIPIAPDGKCERVGEVSEVIRFTGARVSIYLPGHIVEALIELKPDGCSQDPDDLPVLAREALEAWAAQNPAPISKVYGPAPTPPMSTPTAAPETSGGES